MRFLHLALLASLAAFGTTAHAESAWRAGIGLAKSTLDVDDSDFKGDSTAWEVFGGWELNRYLAAEAGFIDLGTIDDQLDESVFDFDSRGYYASVLGSLPLGEGFSVYGRAGMLAWRYEAEERVDGDIVAEGKDDGNDPLFGVGVAAHLDGALLRLEYRLSEIDDAHVDLLGLAVVWRF